MNVGLDGKTAPLLRSFPASISPLVAVHGVCSKEQVMNRCSVWARGRRQKRANDAGLQANGAELPIDSKIACPSRR